MNRIKLFEEFTTNPFNPDEIWDKEVDLNENRNYGTTSRFSRWFDR
jgi:hypothetical protein